MGRGSGVEAGMPTRKARRLHALEARLNAYGETCLADLMQNRDESRHRPGKGAQATALGASDWLTDSGADKWHKLRFLCLTGVFGRCNSGKMNVRSDILET